MLVDFQRRPLLYYAVFVTAIILGYVVGSVLAQGVIDIIGLMA